MTVRALRRGSIAASQVSSAPFSLNEPTLVIAASGSNADATGYTTTAGADPTANALVLIAVGFSGGTNVGPTSITGNGITYSLVAESFNAVSTVGVALWAGSAASPSVGAVSINFGETKTSCAWVVHEYTGSVTPAIVQSKIANSGSGTPSSLSVTLDAVPDASSAAAGLFLHTNTGDFTAGTDFTIVGQNTRTAPNTVTMVEYDLVPVDAVVDCTFSSGRWAGIAFEVGAPI